MIGGKRGMLGEGLLMIYRLVLITFIALIVLGASAVFYDYYLDVRDTEARIMIREVMNCLAPEGVLDLERFAEEGVDKRFMSVCGFNSEELNRFYISGEIYSGGKLIKEVEQGDSGSRWIKDLFESKSEAIGKYEPGFIDWVYPVVIAREGLSNKEGTIKVEVFVNHEF